MIVGQKQNLLDITLQSTGSLEALFEVSEQTGLSVTSDLEAGTELNVSEKISLKKIMYDANAWRPGTNWTDGKGIGYDPIPNEVY